MSEYSEYFLNSPAAVAQLDLLEIAHPNFSQTYRLVRNHADGVTATHENSASYTYIYCPLSLTNKGDRTNLDQGLSILLGDVGEIFPNEIDAIRAANGFSSLPTCTYRTYRSDDLTAPIYGPLTFEIPSVSTNHEGLQFDAVAPHLSLRATGEVYNTYDYPSLRGFLS